MVKKREVVTVILESVSQSVSGHGHGDPSKCTSVRCHCVKAAGFSSPTYTDWERLG